MTREEFQEVLRLHKLWLMGEPAGKRADLTSANLTDANLTRANLTSADLTDADLIGAKLIGANLTRADLTRADLTRADLTSANLTDANLTRANLTDANLTRANLTRADLTDADLTDANLTRANLTDADLTDADLTGANLTGAYLTGANLTGADLTNANLTGAYLTGANLTDAKNNVLSMARTSICPEGEIVGWKKLRGGRIARLTIPREAKRSNATGRKCRAEYAVVEKIFEGTDEVSEGISQRDENFIYRVGETVRPDKWDDNRWNECSSGIHYFITREEAEAY